MKKTWSKANTLILGIKTTDSKIRATYKKNGYARTKHSAIFTKRQTKFASSVFVDLQNWYLFVNKSSCLYIMSKMSFLLSLIGRWLSCTLCLGTFKFYSVQSIIHCSIPDTVEMIEIYFKIDECGAWASNLFKQRHV